VESEGIEMATSETASALTVNTEDGRSVLTLHGTVGIQQAGDLHFVTTQLAEYEGAVLVHCEALEHLDTAGIQLLLALKAARSRLERSTVLVSVPERVTGYLKAAGVADLLLERGA
jgi:anti-anti-sigma factor